MTGSLPGLLLFDLVLLITGVAALASLHPARSLRSVAASTGLAFWVGLALEGVVMTWISTLGLGPRVPVVLGIAAVPVVVAIVRRARQTGPSEHDSARRLSPLAALGFGLISMICAGQFLAAWNRPLGEWDGWAFWIPKARLLYDTGHLHAAEITQFSGTTYPPLVPLIHGAAFGFMGASDEVTLHLQAALFFAAFIHAVASLSRRVASDVYVVPFVLVLATIPRMLGRSLQLDGDYPTEFTFALAALLCALYLRNGRKWSLGCAAVLLAASANIRREGLVYVLAIFAAAVAVTLIQRRRGLWLVLPAAFAGAAAVPWLLWVKVHHVQADSVAPAGVVSSAIGGHGPGGSLPHAVGVLFSYLFRFDYWSVAPYVGFLAFVAVVLAGRRAWSFAAFVGAILLVTGVAMFWRLLWYGGDLNPSGTPIPRISGMWAILLCAIAPLLCSVALPRLPADLVRFCRDWEWRGAAFLVPVFTLVPVVGIVLFAAPHINQRVTGCDPPASPDGPQMVVFSREPTYGAAQELLAAVVKVGFVEATIDFDGCGRLRVQTPAPSLEVARQIQAEARSVDLKTTIRGA